ncbi:MAG TPA: serine/threonine-protein kinase, partial [Ktedonobacteraceae bacterium]
MVFEAVQGETLRQRIQAAQTSLSEPDARALAIQVCEALAILHEHGIIHRDLTPEHIRIRPEKPLQLTDLGRAERIRRPRIRWRQIGFPEGTPDYLAPELWWGSPGSVQSDIYAVGVILYELVCGHTPFRHVERLALLVPQLAFDPPDIRCSCHALSSAFVAVLMRMIRRDPHKRYATIQDVHAALSHLDQVSVVEYVPDHSLLGGNYRLVLFL